MAKILIAILIAIGIFFKLYHTDSSTGPTPSPAPQISAATPLKTGQLPDSLKDIDQIVAKAMVDWNVPGAAVAIVHDGQVVYQKAFGVRKMGDMTKVDEDTLFQIASISKTFNAFIWSHLVDEGKLKWDTPIVSELKDFQLGSDTATQKITFLDALTHRSGLDAFAGDTLQASGYSIDEIYKHLRDLPMKGPVGDAYVYTNSLVGILGRVIENKAGQSAEALFAEKLFKPLGLSRTFIGYEPYAKDNNAAWPHDTFQRQTRLREKTPLTSVFKVSTSVSSSIKDMTRWMIALMDGGKTPDGKELISRAGWKMITTNHTNAGAPRGGHLFPKNRVRNIQVGIGMFIYDYAGAVAMGHAGGMLGCRSVMAWLPKQKIGVVVLSNLGGMRLSFFPEAIRNWVFDRALDLPNYDWGGELKADHRKLVTNIMGAQNLRMMKTGNQAPRDLNLYVGKFTHALYGDIESRVDSGKLVLLYRGNRAELKPAGGDQFHVVGSHLVPGLDGTYAGFATFTFEKDQDLSTLRVDFLNEGKDQEFRVVG